MIICLVIYFIYKYIIYISFILLILLLLFIILCTNFILYIYFNIYFIYLYLFTFTNYTQHFCEESGTSPELYNTEVLIMRIMSKIGKKTTKQSSRD